MFVPPEQRQPCYPPERQNDKPRRSDAVLPWLIGVFLVAMLVGPIGGSTVVEALLALLHGSSVGAHS